MQQPKRDARKLVKTASPGIYRRANADGSLGQYVVIFRAGGKQRREYADTFDRARRIKRERETDRDRGEWQERTTITLRAFLAEWIDRYHGTGRRGFREGTRDEYRRLLEQYAHAFFAERLRLVDVTPRHLAQFVAWLADEDKQGQRLADSTIANAVVPVRAALATARREGMIRHNPGDGVALPVREEVRDEDDEEAKALSREQLSLLLALVPERYRLLVRLVAFTGLRISEAVALQRRHLQLDGENPELRVRRARVRGRVEPPKTRHGRRSVPLAASLVAELRAHLADVADTPDALVFATRNGTFLDADNMRKRMLKPLLEEVGAGWAGWHSLRHTFASLQLADGCNIVQLSRVLGHHSAAFTLTVYAHLLEGEQAPALDPERVLRVNARVNVSHVVTTESTEGEAAEIAA